MHICILTWHEMNILRGIFGEVTPTVIATNQMMSPTNNEGFRLER